MGERQVADQGLGELEEPVGVLFAPIRLLPGGLQVGDHSSHDQHHDHVDDQGNPVLWRTDGQGAVGRKEEDVVNQEPGHRSHRARNEPAHHNAENDGDYQDQCRCGDGEVGNMRNRKAASPTRATMVPTATRRYAPLVVCMLGIAFVTNFPAISITCPRVYRCPSWCRPVNER